MTLEIDDLDLVPSRQVLLADPPQIGHRRERARSLSRHVQLKAEDLLAGGLHLAIPLVRGPTRSSSSFRRASSASLSAFAAPASSFDSSSSSACRETCSEAIWAIK